MEITVDPGRDTPARLAAYSKEFGADWVMRREHRPTSTALWKFFGVSVQIVPEEQPAKIDWYTGTPLTYDVEPHRRLLPHRPRRPRAIQRSQRPQPARTAGP